tara:strand:- start:328 stop:552 length:225 start_codon:yes stop_codon:yes gene_type:complete
MALLTGVGTTIPQHESIAYYNWVVMFQLLEHGIAWDAVQAMTEDQIHIALGVAAAMKQREQEAAARQQASQMRM